MKLFGTYTYLWWQIGIFKLALLSIGAAIGVWWHEELREYLTVLIVVAVVASLYSISVSLQQALKK